MGLFSVVCLPIFGIAIIIAVTYGQNPSSNEGVEVLRIKKSLITIKALMSLFVPR